MKHIVVLILIVVLLAGGWYAYSLYTGKVKSLTEIKTDVTISAANLVAAFERDSATANKLYLGKIVTVSGTVKSVEKESGTLVLGNADVMSSVRCSMDSAFVKDMAALNAGVPIIIKGACTGYNAGELGLGSDVVLNRCVLVSNKK